MLVQRQVRRRGKSNSKMLSSGDNAVAMAAGGSGRRGRHGGEVNGRISFLGPEPIPIIQMLRVFDKIGDGFAESLTSLRQISQYLEQLSFRGEYPDDLPYGTSSLSRYCAAAEIYFAQHFGLDNKADLFIRKGPGESIIGMTDVGAGAWSLCNDFLFWYGIVKE